MNSILGDSQRWKAGLMAMVFPMSTGVNVVLTCPAAQGKCEEMWSCEGSQVLQAALEEDAFYVA